MDDVLPRLRNVLEESGITGLLREVDEEINRLRIGALYVAVLGQFKRGKTTLINAIIGEDLLPSAVTPVTSVVTLLHSAGERTARIVYDGRGTEEISFQSGVRIRDGLQQVLSGKLESTFNAWRAQHEHEIFERHQSHLHAYARCRETFALGMFILR